MGRFEPIFSVYFSKSVNIIDSLDKKENDMTDQTKFEEMLEKLVNEDRDGAEALFHEIVVEKSREIYTNILDEADEEVEETTDEEVEETTDEEVEESDDEDLDESDDEDLDESDDEDLDEMFGLNEPEMEAEPDPAMDMMGDMEPEMGGDDEEGDDEEGEADGPEAAMDNLEDALEELKAAFADMMGDEEPGEEEPEEEAMAFEAADEEVEEAADEEVEEAADEEVEEARTTPKSASETMREYVEKIADPSNQEGADNKKSTVAGKNDMGGTASNLNQGKDGGHPEAGAGSTVQGSALSDTSAKEDNAGNVNVPGGKASKSMKSQPGHGAEKKGKPENAANKKSMTGS
jgi:hypothetical protein